MAYGSLEMSYNNLGELTLGRDTLKKAFDLANRVSEHERLIIAAQWYSFGSGELDKARQAYQVLLQMYPRDTRAWLDLGIIDSELGDFTGSAEATAKIAAVNPNHPEGIYYANLMNAYLCLNRLDEAKAVYQDSVAHGADYYIMHLNHYFLAFDQNDASAMKQEEDWGAGKPGMEDFFFASEADTAAYYGRLGEAARLSRHAVESARNSQEPETAAQWMAAAALRHALFGDSSAARAKGAAALAFSHGHDVDSLTALPLALAGDANGAVALAANLDLEFPLDTLVQRNYLPEIRAEIALHHGDAAKAIDLLQAAIPYDTVQTNNNDLILVPPYERGRAYLQAHNGSAAAAEFQKVLDHPGLVFNSPIGPLARLGLARAYALAGDKDKSRTAYQDFLGIWKNADPDVPVLKEVKVEYGKL
jgi:hypothetical protein